MVTIVDRIKDMIVTGGENVYSAEVENVVAQFSVVLNAPMPMPMPMPGAGKILKRELRLPFWEGKERRVN